MKKALKALMVATALSPASIVGTATVSHSQEALYTRLGGYDAIAAVVDDFFGRMASDEQLGRFFENLADDRKEIARQLTVDFICAAAGGPCIYNGRDMPVTHTGMGITASDWDVSVVLLKETLAAFSVPEAEQADVIGFIGSLRDQVVDN